MDMIEKILRRAKETGVSQSMIEEKARLSANRISKWKGGTGEPTAREALRIARFLDLPVEYLVDDSIDDPSRFGGVGPVIARLVARMGEEEAIRRLAQIETGVVGEPGSNPETRRRVDSSA